MAYRKLTLKNKKKIVQLHTEEKLSYSELSERFGVSESTISLILTKARKATKENKRR